MVVRRGGVVWVIRTGFDLFHFDRPSGAQSGPDGCVPKSVQGSWFLFHFIPVPWRKLPDREPDPSVPVSY